MHKLLILGVALMGVPVWAQTTLDDLEAEQQTSREREVKPVLSPEAYRAQAEAAYDRAMTQLRRGLGMEASASFTALRQNFPFSRFATLAELGSAQAEALQGNPDAAVDGFTRFIEQHPNHEKLADARYAIVDVLWAERPSDFFLLPPAHERDLSDVQSTLRALEAFARFHPEDERLVALKKTRDQAERLLLNQQLYLAQWNAKSGQPRAALRRAQAAVQRYPEVRLSAEERTLLARLRADVDQVKRVAAERSPELHPERSAFAPQPKEQP